MSAGLRAIGAPRSSLNTPVGPSRRYAVVSLPLAAARAVAHARGGKVNDVVLTLVGGGVRRLLQSRGEQVSELTVRVGVTVSTRATGETAAGGNRFGVIVVPVGLAEADPGSRLCAIIARTGPAKRDQHPANAQWVLVWLARLRLLHRFARRQRLTSFVVSNVPGPAEPIVVFGAPVRDLVPLGTLSGNHTLAFVALSYADRLTVTVIADPRLHPDLPLVAEGMTADWTALQQGGRPEERPVRGSS